MQCLDAPSGPAAAQLDPAAFAHAARGVEVARDGALLVPDTAVPTLAWLQQLEDELDRPVLTANQVSLWQVAALAGLVPSLPGLGRLFGEDAAPAAKPRS